MDVELEHGLHDSSMNVTGDDPVFTGKIALAHLNEFPDYYTSQKSLKRRFSESHHREAILMLRRIELFPGGREKTSWLPRRAQQAFHLTARTTRCSSRATTSSVRSPRFANTLSGLASTSMPPLGSPTTVAPSDTSSVREDQFEKAVSVLGL